MEWDDSRQAYRLSTGRELHFPEGACLISRVDGRVYALFDAGAVYDAGCVDYLFTGWSRAEREEFAGEMTRLWQQWASQEPPE